MIKNIKHPVASIQHLFEEADLSQVHKWTRIRVWAAKNAYTLIFLVCLFIITWIIQVLTTNFQF